MKENDRFCILSSFWLKILALLFMTLDHVGCMLEIYAGGGIICYLLRVFGRMALPLFCFLIVEGVLHTKSYKKYALRLLIELTSISIVLALFKYVPFFQGLGLDLLGGCNIFIDLLLGSLIIYLLKQDNPYLKPLAILPFGYGVLSYSVTAYEVYKRAEIHWLPTYLRTDSGVLAIILIVVIYLSTIAYDYFKKVNEEKGLFIEENKDRFYKNVFAVVSVLLVLLINFALSFILAPELFLFDPSIEAFGIFSGAFILLYNGLRGYNKKWFQYGAYIYYPLHLVIIYIIFELIYIL